MNDISKQAVVVSLYPAPMGEVKRAGFSPAPVFTMAACESLDKPVLLVVGMQTERPYMGLGRNSLQTWPAKDVADDIVREWTGGLPGTNLSVGALPGVWVSEGAQKINGEWVIPASEMAAQRKGLDLTLQRLVMMARALFGTDGKNSGHILPVMHVAAKWLKVEGELWQQDLTSDGRASCPYCKKRNEPGASICWNCKHVIDQAAFDRAQDIVHRHETAIEGSGENDGLPPDEQALALAAKSGNKGNNKPANATA